MGKKCRAARAWHSITISTPVPRPPGLYRYFANHTQPTKTTTKGSKNLQFLSHFFFFVAVVCILFSFNIDKEPAQKKSEGRGGAVKNEQ